MSTNRRQFLQLLAAGAVTVRRGIARAGGKMPRRPLGSTGVDVSLVGLGGYHIGKPKEDAEATRIMHAAIDHGVTFFDNCWDYNAGKSEERMGRALADGRRNKVFLMTKLDGRTRAVRGLRRLRRRTRTGDADRRAAVRGGVGC